MRGLDRSRWRCALGAGLFFAGLLAFGSTARAWFHVEQADIFSEYENPVTQVTPKANSKYLFTLHREADRFFMFVIFRGTCIGRVEMKRSFSSSDLASQLARYQEGSTWKLVQEHKETIDPNKQKKGVFKKKSEATPTPPAQLAECEMKGWQRQDRRFYALWFSMRQSSNEMHLLALGEKKAGVAIMKYFKDIEVMIFEWLKQTKQSA